MSRARNGSSRLGGIAVVLVAVAGLLLWGATRLVDDADSTGTTPPAPGTPAPSASPSPPPSGWAESTPAALPAGLVDVAAGTAGELPLAILAQVVEQAPVVVTVDTAEGARWEEATTLATALRAPLVLVDQPPTSEPEASPTASPTATPDASTTGDASPTANATAAARPDGPATVDALLEGWATEHVVAVGDAPSTTAQVHAVEVVAERAGATPTTTASSPSAAASPGASPSTTAEPEGRRPEQVEAMLTDARASDAAEPSGDAVVVARPGDDATLVRADVAATLGQLGIEVAAWEAEDPRADQDLRAAMGNAETWLAAVADDQLPDLPNVDWDYMLTATASAPELPGGGLTLFPDKTFIATYGNPTGPALGVMGERDVQGSIEFVEGLVAEYEGLFGDSRVQPAFEIITTIASAEAGDDGDYSRTEDLDLVTEWVDAATEAGLYVVLDLQPGRTDFLTQAMTLEALLRRPNVGLALDPEWRLEPDQVHLRQIGQVHAEEVNQVSEWLAGLVREHNLPEKLLIVHNFQLRMLPDRADLVRHPELATMVHVDGQGAQDAKDDTYRVITEAGPDWLWWGWKNFYDEDVPGIRSPQDTAAVTPPPHFISYQ